ncbi:MAG TPA: 3'-5' exonuclease [Longimicrobiales bacterium]
MVAAAELSSLEYAIVDVETTGGSASRGHRITEVGVVCLNGEGRFIGEFKTLVNPFRPIPPSITRLTGITDGMAADAPSFAEIAPELRRWLDGRVFVAHNAGFDWRFVGFEMEQTTGIRMSAPVLCTVRMARKLVPEIRSRSLDALQSFFGVHNEARHRAYGDARATARIFRRMYFRLADQSVFSWGELQQLLDAPGRKGRKKKSALPTSMEFIEGC